MTDAPVTAYLALGSNMGDRQSHLALARARIAALRGSRILAESVVEETDALTGDEEPQEDYLNQMIALETSLTPSQLLDAVQAIENEAGRVRGKKWAPRTLDIDIVLYGNEQIDTPRLRIPHPELPNREFWLRELGQLRPER